MHVFIKQVNLILGVKFRSLRISWTVEIVSSQKSDKSDGALSVTYIRHMEPFHPCPTLVQFYGKRNELILNRGVNPVACTVYRPAALHVNESLEQSSSNVPPSSRDAQTSSLRHREHRSLGPRGHTTPLRCKTRHERSHQMCDAQHCTIQDPERVRGHLFDSFPS